jgi:hypothetical protein
MQVRKHRFINHKQKEPAKKVMMKSYLVSVEPDELNTVVSVLKAEQVTIKNVLDNISLVVVNCPEEKLPVLKNIKGVQAIEEEGTSYAI